MQTQEIEATVTKESASINFIKAAAPDNSIVVAFYVQGWNIVINRRHGTDLSFSPYDNVITALFDPETRKYYDLVMAKYKELEATVQVSTPRASKTMIRCPVGLLTIHRPDMLKYIAEADSPLELTRFDAQMTWDYKSMHINFVPSSYDVVPSNTNINNIMPKEAWAMFKKIAQETVDEMKKKEEEKAAKQARRDLKKKAESEKKETTTETTPESTAEPTVTTETSA